MDLPESVEFKIVRALIIKKYGVESPFLKQLAMVLSTSRQMTGKGFYLDLEMPPSAEAVDKVNAEISVDFRTIFSEPNDLVGFTLFIRGGLLNFLEGYTFGPFPWPQEPIEGWLLLESPLAETSGPNRRPSPFDLTPPMRPIANGEAGDSERQLRHDIYINWRRLAA
jgi:hypothetical protein